MYPGVESDGRRTEAANVKFNVMVLSAHQKLGKAIKKKLTVFIFIPKIKRTNKKPVPFILVIWIQFSDIKGHRSYIAVKNKDA